AEIEKERAQIARTRRFQKRSAWALAVVGVLVTVGIVAAAVQSRSVAQREAIVLTSLANRASEDGYHDRAVRIAVHGLPAAGSMPWIDPWSPELEAKLSGGVMMSRLTAQLNGHTGSVVTAVFNRNGTRILTASGRTGSLVASDTTARL